MHLTCKAALSGLVSSTVPRTTSTLPAAFLLPAFNNLNLSQQQTSNFSTTQNLCARKRRRRDNNPNRGVSALHRTGLKARAFDFLGSRHNAKRASPTLPQPVLDPQKRSDVLVPENHGLWGFFNEDRAALTTPEGDSNHGRGWRVQELRSKSWEDLHALWWMCVKERNRIATYDAERTRLKAGYGQHESEMRLAEVKRTQKSIKQTLTQRWYAWENARVAAMEDEEIDLYADPEKGEPAYLPKGRTQEDNVPPPAPKRAETDETLPPPVNEKNAREVRA